MLPMYPIPKIKNHKARNWVDDLKTRKKDVAWERAMDVAMSDATDATEQTENLADYAPEVAEAPKKPRRKAQETLTAQETQTDRETK